MDTGDGVNQSLRLEALLVRVMADLCPGVQACPSNLPVQHGKTANGRQELWQVVASTDAPRRWQDLGQPFDRRGEGVRARRFWQAEAEQAMGCAVTLECGENDEIWCRHRQKQDALATTITASARPFADDSAQARQVLCVGSGHAA